MNQLIAQSHALDEKENPAGGHTSGTGLEIDWQNGPLAIDGERKEPNGAFVEGVLQAALGRLEFYQTTRFKCRENALAITKIEEALHWCGHRTAGREARGVEGTHTAYGSLAADIASAGYARHESADGPELFDHWETGSAP